MWDEEHIKQDAARWFVFLAENPHISLGVMFGSEREKYADITVSEDGCSLEETIDNVLDALDM